MKIISESVIKSNTGKAFAVKKGRIIRVIGESAQRISASHQATKDLRRADENQYFVMRKAVERGNSTTGLFQI